MQFWQPAQYIPVVHSEPDIFVFGEAGHEQRMLARYRSPRKDPQIVDCEWIQTLIALEKIGYGTFTPCVLMH